MAHERSRLQDEAIARLASNIARYRAGELTAEQFRPLRLGMGVYAQLPHVKHMQRIKIPGGVLTADQLDAIAEVTARWGRGSAHVTVRQDIQVHYLELEDSVETAALLAQAGVTTVGACADSVRNVTASPYGGILEDEVFDVTPHAHAITQHFLFHEMNLKLPRKFKIGISGSVRDEAQVMINDIGLFARVTDRGRGFALYVAGGLGSTPEIAHAWLDFIAEADLLAACEAIVRVYFRDGERKNRKKNRMKFLLRALGEAEFLRRLDAELQVVLCERGAALRETQAGYISEYREPTPQPAEPGEPIGDGAFARWKRTNAMAQTQHGYHAAIIKLPLGDASAEQLRSIAALSREFGNGTVRATNQQNLLLRFIPSRRLYALFRAVVAIGLGEADALHITDVVSCPGTDYCSLAITKSMGVASLIREHLEEGTTRQEGQDVVAEVGRFEIKISGCPNACGQHQVGDIGMTGLMVTGKDGVERPHYSLRVGGGCGEGARVGSRISGRIPEEQTPAVVAAIARFYLGERGSGESFRDFVARVGADALGKVGLSAAPGAV
ncbi:MAG TPA: nitrite/sulfite reductase [Polyangiaceae bacterium]|nr:nitrite/sulfite reductase [Polyangiaceae bacterium]